MEGTRLGFALERTIRVWCPDLVRRKKKKKNENGQLLDPVLKSKKKKLSLCLINEALCHEHVWGSGGIAKPFLTSALDGCEWSASLLGCFNPREIFPGNHWIGGWMGLRACLEFVNKRKILPRPSNP
jgi:hypothetical protein